MTVRDLILVASGSMHLWRDAAVAGLAAVAIVGIWLYVSLVDA